ncbi:MAG: hypothetical protein IJY14_01795 [Acholeplasmatales bacterium]|nr:hypothetical protein [Acholeplasmatales bacterium]
MKKIGLFICLSLAMLSIVGCSDSKNDEESIEPSNPTPSVEPSNSIELNDSTPSADGPIYGGIFSIDASQLEIVPSSIEKEFEYDGHKLAYKNVYKKANEFVICDGGYIKSINGIPDYLMRFFISDNIKVYKCDSEGNIIEPKEEVSVHGVIDNRQSYLLAGASNFIIINESGDGSEVNIGALYFWC